MINRVIEFSANNKFLIFAFLAAACLWGAWAGFHLPLDAIPDLSETQVIILSRWDRSPDIIEDQVTSPILSAMTGAPRVRTVRGISDYGFSYVYVIFQEGTDIYWARSRVLEYMSKITGKLPEGVAPQLGPDATGVGWAFECALVDESAANNLAAYNTPDDKVMEAIRASNSEVGGRVMESAGNEYLVRGRG